MLMNGAKFYNIQESLLYFRFSPDMFKRRGGWKYMINELHFLQMMRQMHFISFSQFMQNLFVRFSIRLIPNSLRAFNTGMAVFDGAMLGIKLMKKVRKIFRR